MPTWVCRTECFWRDYRYSPGDTVEVESKFKWDYSGGYWHPEGAEVIDKSHNLTIPRHFEPTDFSVLTDPQLVAFARENIKVKRKFQFTHEVQDAPPPDDEPLKPLDPEKIKKRPAVPEKINPGDIGKASRK